MKTVSIGQDKYCDLRISHIYHDDQSATIKIVYEEGLTVNYIITTVENAVNLGFINPIVLNKLINE